MKMSILRILCISLTAVCTCIMALSDDPCTSYLKLNDSSMVLSYTSTASCTGHITSGAWYRYQGTKEGLLATECPTGNQCGTSNQVWMSGNIPTVNDGIQQVKVCIRNPSKCCDRQRTLTMKNCKTFVVYQLIALPSSTPCRRYCFNQSSDALYLSTTTPSTTTPTTTTVPTTTSTTSTPTPTTTLPSTTSPTTTTVPTMTSTTSTQTPTTTLPPTTTHTTTTVPTTTSTTSTPTPTTTLPPTTTSTTTTVPTTTSTTSTPTPTTTLPPTTTPTTTTVPTTKTSTTHCPSTTKQSTPSTSAATDRRPTALSRITTAIERATTITTSNTTRAYSTEGNSSTSTDDLESYLSANKVWVSVCVVAAALIILFLVVICMKCRINSERKAKGGNNRAQLYGVQVAQEGGTNATELHRNPGQSGNWKQRLSKGSDIWGSAVHTRYFR